MSTNVMIVVAAAFCAGLFAFGWQNHAAPLSEAEIRCSTFAPNANRRELRECAAHLEHAERVFGAVFKALQQPAR